MEFDRDKFKRLVHYIIWRAGQKDGFGATKLNKVLWYADARMYLLRRKPITGATYIREKHGPVPRQFVPIRDELAGEGQIRVTQDRYYNRPITVFRALAAPDMQGFDPEEIKTVDWWIAHIDEEHTAASISEKSHDYTWEIAKMGEVIPYHAILATRIRDPNDEELEWAKSKIKQRDFF